MFNWLNRSAQLSKQFFDILMLFMTPRHTEVNPTPGSTVLLNLLFAHLQACHVKQASPTYKLRVYYASETSPSVTDAFRQIISGCKAMIGSSWTRRRNICLGSEPRTSQICLTAPVVCRIRGDSPSHRDPMTPESSIFGQVRGGGFLTGWRWSQVEPCGAPLARLLGGDQLSPRWNREELSHLTSYNSTWPSGHPWNLHVGSFATNAWTTPAGQNRRVVEEGRGRRVKRRESHGYWVKITVTPDDRDLPTTPHDTWVLLLSSKQKRT
ncbi:hypothetical protein K438DRAFT_1759864 [Mycena galopus ATCC 62051]|nr:hypothetical protein K438DRAFT_1759864 [Mycena galopus ATCC 62051]